MLQSLPHRGSASTCSRQNVANDYLNSSLCQQPPCTPAICSRSSRHAPELACPGTQLHAVWSRQPDWLDEEFEREERLRAARRRVQQDEQRLQQETLARLQAQEAHDQVMAEQRRSTSEREGYEEVRKQVSPVVDVTAGLVLFVRASVTTKRTADNMAHLLAARKRRQPKRLNLAPSRTPLQIRYSVDCR